MKTIVINGYTGAETVDDRARLYEQKVAEIRRTTTTLDEAVQQFQQWLNHHHASYGAARYHNAIAAPATRYTTLRRVATQRIRECDEAYADLAKRTTTAWHAAHHRFVLAACEARARLVDLLEAANELHAAAAGPLEHVTRAEYETMVAADGRAFDLPDLDTLRAELDEFVETRRERFTLLAATIAGTPPAGFEPPAADPAEADDAERIRARRSVRG